MSILIDVQYMQRMFSNFKAPTFGELNSLKVGDIVKICLNGDYLWVKITKLSYKFVQSDSISFEKRHIYEVLH